jgi:hypothetical protein
MKSDTSGIHYRGCSRLHSASGSDISTANSYHVTLLSTWKKLSFDTPVPEPWSLERAAKHLVLHPTRSRICECAASMGSFFEYQEFRYLRPEMCGHSRTPWRRNAGPICTLLACLNILTKVLTHKTWFSLHFSHSQPLHRQFSISCPRHTYPQTHTSQK